MIKNHKCNLKTNESMGNKNNIKSRKRDYRNANHKLFNRCTTRRLFILIIIYTQCQPIIVFIEEPTWLQNWRAWKKRYKHFTPVFFVDDLKTYASDKKSAKLQLDLISQFMRDVSMQLGSDKCAYLNIERGNQKSLGKFLALDETKLAELTEGKCYKYLGQDENIGYNDVLNKERVIKEYMK